jgi:hypothetical protein
MKKHCTPRVFRSWVGIPSIIVVFMLLGTIYASAQAPKMFNFQGVARDATGKVVANAEIGYSFNIHRGTPVGTIVFTKEGSTTTNSSGIFNVTVGTEANPIPDLEWSSKIYYLQVGVDADGATNGYTFVDVGTTQLLSVPYSLYSNEAGKWRDDSPIIQKGVLGGLPIPPVGNGPTLLWHPDKAAFRAGNATNNYWDDALIGDYSFAAGTGTRAIGLASIAMGDGSAALANNAIAFGDDATANGPSSIALGAGSFTGAVKATAIGNNTVANGNNSISLGFGATAKSFSGIVTGNYNNISDNPSPSSGVSSDRLFQIGNGTSTNNRSNAMTILRNGNIGIGNNALTPEFIMDFGGRPRIRHNGATAGLFFDTSEGNPDGFVGMMTNNQIGFYLKDGWKLWTTDTGNCVISEAGYYLSSDIKLKTNISPHNRKFVQAYQTKWI